MWGWIRWWTHLGIRLTAKKPMDAAADLGRAPMLVDNLDLQTAAIGNVV